MKLIKGIQLRVFTRSLLLGLMSLLTYVAGSVHAQTTEQLQLFNSLDPVQQQSILQGLGQSASGGLSANEVLRPTSSVLPDSNRLIKSQGLNGIPLQPSEVKLQGLDTLLVDVVLPTDPIGIPQDRVDLINQKNPYDLDQSGVLHLPGLTPIYLSGLTIDQATRRLSAESGLRGLTIKLTYLPIVKSGFSGLKPYGYDLFAQAPSTFAPVTEVPVPADYTVGAGDQFVVQLYGSTNRTLRLVVGRDGIINFPDLGPINVGGRSFSSVQADLESQVSRKIIGVKASVSMGDTRSIRVFVLGEANLPGSYTVSGLSTMTTALFVSGGVKTIGSLRNIQLKRQGVVVRTLDLYDLLMKGDTSNDAKLMPGDVIYVPTVGKTVAVDGEVRRPAIYELKGTQTTSDAITLAGGITPEADISKASLVRINAQRHRTAIELNLGAANTDKVTLSNGDTLLVPRISPTLDSGVILSGHLHAPRTVAWRSGLRLTDVIGSVDELKPNADLHYVLIRRELAPDRSVAVLSADLSKALANKGGTDDVILQARDRITIFDYESDRAIVIKPILDELRLQSQSLRPTETVKVAGRIKVAGEYPLEPGMRISDLIRAGGSLQDAAYAPNAELIRRVIGPNDQRTTELINVELGALLAGNTDADLVLKSADELYIKELPNWNELARVVLSGEVKFPGTYILRRGETLRSVIERAGGLTEFAYLKGSVFTREEIKQREQEQIDQLASRMQSDLALMSLEAAQSNQQGSSSTLTTGRQLLNQLKSTKAVGRLVIDLEQVLSAQVGTIDDVMLKDGDKLLIPRIKQSVTVLGEVQSPVSHIYVKELSQGDYVNQSGGETKKADSKLTYVVRANGGVVVANSGWFKRNTEILPGDTIVVPLDTERMPLLPLWQGITQILYNTAIAAAALNSF